MTLLDRIAERRAGLVEEADRLRKQLAEVEDELERVTVTEQVVMRLIEEGGEPDEQVGGQTYLVAARPAPASLSGPPMRVMIPHRREVGGADDLPDGYQDLLAAVMRAAEPVRCKQICEQLELGTEPRHVEAVRAKLKRLADRGWLRCNGAGMFTATP